MSTAVSINKIQDILRRMEESSSQAEATKTFFGILSIMSRDESNKNTIANDGIGTIISMISLHGDKMDVQESGCDLLWSLSFNSSHAKECIAKHGGPAVLVKALKRFSGFSDFLKSACGALSNMCQSKLNQEGVASQGGLQPLVSAIHVHNANAKLLPFIFDALASLIVSNEENARALSSLGVIPLVMSSIRRHKTVTDVIKSGCHALAILTDVKSQANKIALAGGVHAILSLLDLHPAYVDLHRVAAVVLLRMLQESAHVARAILSNEGIRILLKSIDKGGAQQDTVAAVTHILFTVTNPTSASSILVETQLWISSNNTKSANRTNNSVIGVSDGPLGKSSDFLITLAGRQFVRSTHASVRLPSASADSDAATTGNPNPSTSLECLLKTLTQYIERRDVVRATCRLLTNLTGYSSVIIALEKVGLLDKLFECACHHAETKDIIDSACALLKVVCKSFIPVFRSTKITAVKGLLIVFRHKFNDDDALAICADTLSKNIEYTQEESEQSIKSRYLIELEDFRTRNGKTWEMQSLNYSLKACKHMMGKDYKPKSSRTEGTDIEGELELDTAKQATSPVKVVCTKQSARALASLVNLMKLVAFSKRFAADSEVSTEMQVVLKMLKESLTSRYVELLDTINSILAIFEPPIDKSTAADEAEGCKYGADFDQLNTENAYGSVLLSPHSPTFKLANASSSPSAVSHKSDSSFLLNVAGVALNSKASKGLSVVVNTTNTISIDSNKSTPLKSASTGTTVDFGASSVFPTSILQKGGIIISDPNSSRITSSRPASPRKAIALSSLQSASSSSSSFAAYAARKATTDAVFPDSRPSTNNTSEIASHESPSATKLISRQEDISRVVFEVSDFKQNLAVRLYPRHPHKILNTSTLTTVTDACSSSESKGKFNSLLDNWPRDLERLDPARLNSALDGLIAASCSALGAESGSCAGGVGGDEVRMHSVYESGSAAGRGLPSKVPIAGCCPYQPPVQGIGEPFAHTLTFDSEFESGNLLRAVQRGDYEYDLFLRPDVHTYGHTQWFYFAVSNTHASAYVASAQVSQDPFVPPVTVKFNIVNLTKPDSLFNLGMKPVIYSCLNAITHGIGWVRAGSNISYFANSYPRFNNAGEGASWYYTLSFSLEFSNPRDTVLIAYSYPYTFSDYRMHMKSLLEQPGSSHVIRVSKLCTTLGGETCDLVTITDFDDKERVGPTSISGMDSTAFRDEPTPPQAQNSSSGNNSFSNTASASANQSRKLAARDFRNVKLKPAIFLSGRVHPGETPASWMMKGILDFLTSEAPAAKLLRQEFVIYIVPVLNPDGVIYGNNRCSLAGVDLNRQWKMPVRNQHPTVYYLKNFMLFQSKIRTISMYVDLHGHSRKYNVFMYGCDDKKKAKVVARAFPKFFSLHEIGQKYVSFDDCSFHVKKARESTSRVVVARELNIACSYTLEASFCGSNYGPLKHCHMNIGHLKEVGVALCDAILNYCIAEGLARDTLVSSFCPSPSKKATEDRKASSKDLDGAAGSQQKNPKDSDSRDINFESLRKTNELADPHCDGDGGGDDRDRDGNDQSDVDSGSESETAVDTDSRMWTNSVAVAASATSGGSSSLNGVSEAIIESQRRSASSAPAKPSTLTASTLPSVSTRRNSPDALPPNEISRGDGKGSALLLRNSLWAPFSGANLVASSSQSDGLFKDPRSSSSFPSDLQPLIQYPKSGGASTGSSTGNGSPPYMRGALKERQFTGMAVAAAAAHFQSNSDGIGFLNGGASRSGLAATRGSSLLGSLGGTRDRMLVLNKVNGVAAPSASSLSKSAEASELTTWSTVRAQAASDGDSDSKIVNNDGAMQLTRSLDSLESLSGLTQGQGNGHGNRSSLYSKSQKEITPILAPVGLGKKKKVTATSKSQSSSGTSKLKNKSLSGKKKAFKGQRNVSSNGDDGDLAGMSTVDDTGDDDDDHENISLALSENCGNGWPRKRAGETINGRSSGESTNIVVLPSLFKSS